MSLRKSYTICSIAFLTAACWLSNQSNIEARIVEVNETANPVFANWAFELMGIATIPGNELDQTPLEGETAEGIPKKLFGGISGLEHVEGSTYLAVSDRGPQDGAIDWPCRFHEIEIEFKEDDSLSATIGKSVMLKDRSQRCFTGLSSAFEANENNSGRFDPEGIRIRNNGNVLVSDEYGPHLIEFSSQGKELKRHPVPESLLIENPGLNKQEENGANVRGRACNRGMEGIAVSPDERFVFGLMQSPLLQDSERDETGKPIGLHVRIVKMDLVENKRWEYVYVLDNPKFKLHEIVYVDENSFLVLENCGGIGKASICKKVTAIDLSDATDVTQLSSIPPRQLPDGILPVQKSTVIDMLDPAYGIAAENVPEKIEGLTFGPMVNGSKTLIVASDNDFEMEQPTRFFVFKLK